MIFSNALNRIKSLLLYCLERLPVIMIFQTWPTIDGVYFYIDLFTTANNSALAMFPDLGTSSSLHHIVQIGISRRSIYSVAEIPLPSCSMGGATRNLSRAEGVHFTSRHEVVPFPSRRHPIRRLRMFLLREEVLSS